MTKVGVLHENARLSRRFWRKLISLMSIWTNYNHIIVLCYNAFNVYRRELAPSTVSLTGDRAQGDDSKHWAYSTLIVGLDL